MGLLKREKWLEIMPQGFKGLKKIFHNVFFLSFSMIEIDTSLQNLRMVSLFGG